MNKKLLFALLISYISFLNSCQAETDIMRINSADKVYSITKGTELDYTFSSVDKNGNTHYYNIEINTAKMNTVPNVTWGTSQQTGDYAGAVEIKLPNDKTEIFYYGYTKPSDGTSKDYVNKKKSRNYAHVEGGAIDNSSGYSYSTINNLIHNEASSSGASSEAYGGAIYNSGTINSIIGDVIANRVSADTHSGGSAIYNGSGRINLIQGNFIGNYAGGDADSGVIYNSNVINSIIGNFISNRISSSAIVQGGVIANRGSSSEIGSVKGDFIGNYTYSTSSVSGGVIYNNGEIGIITGDFVGNSIKTPNSGGYGGAIYNDSKGQIIIKNSNFLGNNVFRPIEGARGGAIYTKNNLDIQAENETSLFRGNYIKSNEQIDYQAIYVNSDSATLKLQSTNNGDIIFDDKISGVDGYGLNITGDSTSAVTLNNDIENANATLTDTNLYMSEGAFSNNKTTLNTNSGTVHFANGESENYQINKLNSDSNANYTIDVDTSNALAPIPDKISTGSGSTGTIKLSKINVIGNGGEYTTQVLYAQDNNIQLDLSDELKNGTTTTSTEYTSDEMRKDVKWNETFNSYKQETTTNSSYGLATTNTTNDSITFNSTSTTGEKTFIGTNGDTLALLNQYETTEDRNFNFDNASDVYTVSDNLGTTSEGTLNINGVANETGRSTIDGGSLALFVLDKESKLNLNNVKVTNAQSVVTGTNRNAEVNLNNAEIVDNTNGIKTAGSVTVKGNSTISNNGEGIEVTSSNSVVTLDATDSIITLNDKISGVNGAKLNLKGGTINIAKKISVLDMSMDNTNVNLQNDNVFNGADLLVKNQSTLNMANNSTNTMYLNSLTLNDNLNMNVDVDLANRSMDRIIANNYNLNNYFVNVTRMNLLSDSDSLTTKILFADNNLKDNVTTTVSEVAYSPIWKYAVAYDKTTGQFVFTRGGDNPNPPTPSVDTLNPAVMVSPVAAQLGGYSGMLDTYTHAFNNMDMRMMNPSKIRMAQKMANRYAISEANDIRYSGNNEKGIWVRPFASYDSVSLKNGPKINNFSYGSFIGGDTNLHEFKNGYLGVLSTHISYLGSHQSFNGNSIWQNGGNLGVTGTLYKGNFFTGLSVNAGASVADASTMYGNEDFPMLMAGVASKTGYNFEFKEGRYIIQPSVLLSYTFVNTFDYTNGAGVRIKSDPLHAIQISPNLRFIMNTKNGWQPYATVGMNWNIMDSTHYKANNTQLPNMSVKPYVQYGLGIQKTMGERLTAFLQVLVRNGGRNGFVATGGLKYFFSKTRKTKDNTRV